MAIIYLDNAASTWPKPPAVKEMMAEVIEDYAANPGRGGHTLAMKASKAVFRTRVQLSRLFGIQNLNNLFFLSKCHTGAQSGDQRILEGGRSCDFFVRRA